MSGQRTPKRLASLLALTAMIGTEMELDKLLQTVVDSARRLLGADLCALLALSEQNPTQFSGIWISGWDVPPQHFPTGSGVFNLPLKTGQPLRLDHVPSHPQSAGTPAGHPPIGPFLGVPLSVRGQILGTLFMANAPGSRCFTDDDEDLLGAFASHAAVAIHNSRLYQQVEELAILRERERMAINLHDTVAQIFFSIGMELERMSESLQGPEHQERLRAMRSLVKTGTVRVREAIGALYSQGGIPEGANLHRQCAALIKEFEAEHRLQAGLVVTGPVDLVPSTLAEVLCRAVQEGLTNVRKHAAADMAVISLVVQDDWVHLTVQDNGRGLDPAVLAQEPHVHRFGLEALRRQLRRLGGTLEIGIGDEGGCLLRVSAPLAGGSPGGTD